MHLSIIIVNYNVKYFLEQCLHSVIKACKGLETETIVVDNNSTDGSIDYLRSNFRNVLFIEKGVNEGFAKGCNEGLKHAKGRYILFLNPDTILAEDTLHKCLQFFEAHPQAGALGVRMVDGRGVFLKESKRSFPSPLTSLFKLFGAATLFPHSKIFGRYHLGHLDERSNHEVDVLAGAFMMIPKNVVHKIGAFDEAFFMYGEDVDLSYRIQKGGYKNYYVADTTIIHFKGESTKRGSLNYVRMFYSAMSIFVKKHYGGARGRLFNWAIQLAIWIRALVAAISKAVRWIGVPVIDAALILASFFFIKELWTAYVRTEINYPQDLLLIAFPSFTITYLVVAYYAGLYNKNFRRSDLFRSTLIATLFLLAAYSLLPEHLRFSRGILLFGALTAFVLISVVRWLMIGAGIINATEQSGKPCILVAGTPGEAAKVSGLLEEAGLKEKIIGRVSTQSSDISAITTLKEVSKTAPVLEAKELILCIGQMTYKEAITSVQGLNTRLRIRFHATGSASIVGSDSSGTTGDVIGSETHFNLKDPGRRRIKRLIDGVSSVIFLLTFPIHLPFVKQPSGFLKNSIQVLFGAKTWIGYNRPAVTLPPLRKGVLAPTGLPLSTEEIEPQDKNTLIDYWYARNYEPGKDLYMLLKNYKRLGS